MKKIILNLAVFQVGWIVCVLGGDLYAVPYTAAALLLHHFVLVSQKSEWKLIALVAGIGCLWDFAMTYSGMIDFAGSSPIGIPLWLVCLWLLFATTFMHGLFWLSRQLWLAVVFAGVAGPATYWLGANLTDVQLGLPVLTSLLVMAVGWAVLFPCGIYYAGRLKS